MILVVHKIAVRPPQRFHLLVELVDDVIDSLCSISVVLVLTLDMIKLFTQSDDDIFLLAVLLTEIDQ